MKNIMTKWMAIGIVLLSCWSNGSVSYGNPDDNSPFGSQSHKRKLDEFSTSDFVENKVKKAKVDDTLLTSQDITEQLPNEIWLEILSYLGYPETKIHQTNRYFFELSLGYKIDDIKVIGIQSDLKKSNVSRFIQPMIKTTEINFMSPHDFEKMPSYVWLNFVYKVKNIPEQYWSLLKNTNIRIIDLKMNSISSHAAVELSKRLPETEVEVLDLRFNNIISAGLFDMMKNLKHSQVHTIYLARNMLENVSQFNFIYNTNGTKINIIF